MFLEQLSKCENGAFVSHAVQEFFRDKSLDEVMRLKTNDDDNLAVFAAWEQMRRSIPKTDQMNRIDMVSASRFLGFVEGRFGIQTPAFWDDAILFSRARSPRDISFFVGKQRQLTKEVALPEAKVKYTIFDSGREVVYINQLPGQSLPAKLVAPLRWDEPRTLQFEVDESKHPISHLIFC